MRFLANENFPLDAVEALGQNGHDVLWIRVESPGISDREVLSRAQAENRILLTFDQDFGELAFRSRLPASVGIILFRIRVPSGASHFCNKQLYLDAKYLYGKPFREFIDFQRFSKLCDWNQNRYYKSL
ncbi:DUF5615 family PIN-like protein, partial [Microcystis aeruginosa]